MNITPNGLNWVGLRENYQTILYIIMVAVFAVAFIVGASVAYTSVLSLFAGEHVINEVGPEYGVGEGGGEWTKAAEETPF